MRLRQCLCCLLLASAMAGCGGGTVTVTVPPRIDLAPFPTIAVVEFAAQPAGELGKDATQRFMAELTAAQPGVRLLELGSREQVLREVGRPELDFQAIKAIGQKFGTAAVLHGTVELSEPRPDVSVSPNLTSVSAQSKIDGRMNAKLWETATGATVWTNTSWGSWRVGGVSLGENGLSGASYRSSQEQRPKVLKELVKALAEDFWPTQERRPRAE
jgi:hypothetical protein